MKKLEDPKSTQNDPKMKFWGSFGKHLIYSYVLFNLNMKAVMAV